MIYSGGNAWRLEGADPKMEIEFVKNLSRLLRQIERRKRRLKIVLTYLLELGEIFDIKSDAG